MCTKANSRKCFLYFSMATLVYSADVLSVQCGASEGVIIKEIGVGNVGFAIPGNGSLNESTAIYFSHLNSDGSTSVKAINLNYNFNDPHGDAIVSLLKTAMLTGVKAKLFNHPNSDCDSINAIALTLN